MANIQGGASGIMADVDTTMKALRTNVRPVEISGWFSIAAQTGLLTTASAGGAIFSIRNASSNLIMIRRVGVGFVCTTAFTAAQRMEFGLIVQRSFSASDSSGTAITISGSNLKHRTSLGTVTNLDARISTTGALTAGTKTPDSNYIGIQGFWVAGVGTSLVTGLDNLFSHNTSDYPLILAQNEGININNIVVMGAAGVGVAYVNVEMAELTSY